MEFSGNLEKDIGLLLELLGGSDDVRVIRHKICGVECAFLFCEEMIDKKLFYDDVCTPALALRGWVCPGGLTKKVSRSGNLLGGALERSIDAAADKASSGQALFLSKGERGALCFGVEGFKSRAISESYTEENVRSSREGFTELLTVNVSLVRRRIKRAGLRVEYRRVGSTRVAVIYIKGLAKPRLVENVVAGLEKAKLKEVLESGFLEPFLRESSFSLFSEIGHTERPDVLCAKIAEGRVGIVVDGTPFALTVPQLFIENFQCFDDYSQKAFYATFIRFIKFASFIISMLLPGAYVAVALHSLEMLPVKMLGNLIIAERSISLPIMIEALFIQTVYEIVREAGLRLPRPVGHAVSLIGALVVGDTAIQAGLVGAPMVMIAAFTAVCSFTIPKLYQVTAILRFAFIIAGGVFGPLGLALGICFVFLNICAVDGYGVPYMSPVAPLGRSLFEDGLLRRSWKRLAANRFDISKLPGERLDENERN